MTFSYSSSIPNPPNDPADDVYTMQTNTSSIAGIIAVDHVGFNVSGGGQHEQVTFNANNVPSLPVSPPVLFTDLPSNHGGAPTYPQLFFYSGNAAQSSNQYSLSGTGSVLLMGGIIMKWGSATISSGNSVAVTFGHAFPNNCFVAVATPNSMAAGLVPGNYPGTNTLTTSGFNLVRNASSGSFTYQYIAIGN